MEGKRGCSEFKFLQKNFSNICLFFNRFLDSQYDWAFSFKNNVCTNCLLIIVRKQLIFFLIIGLHSSLCGLISFDLREDASKLIEKYDLWIFLNPNILFPDNVVACQLRNWIHISRKIFVDISETRKDFVSFFDLHGRSNFRDCFTNYYKILGITSCEHKTFGSIFLAYDTSWSRLMCNKEMGCLESLGMQNLIRMLLSQHVLEHIYTNYLLWIMIIIL